MSDLWRPKGLVRQLAEAHARIKELEHLLKCSEEATRAEQLRADHILQQLTGLRAVLEFERDDPYGELAGEARAERVPT